MDLGLQNKNIIVTGGTRGIGLAAAAACAAEGANISICGRTQDSLNAATAALAVHGTQIHGAICDIADVEQIKTYIAAAEAALGGIDGLVNNPSGFGNTDDAVNGGGAYAGADACAACDWVRRGDVGIGPVVEIE